MLLDYNPNEMETNTSKRILMALIRTNNLFDSRPTIWISNYATVPEEKNPFFELSTIAAP